VPTPAAAHVAVVGGGPGGLMAAEVLATGGVSVTVFEHMPSVGRKFLLAGRGGLNLTHSEPLETFLDRYGGARGRLAPAIAAFGPDSLRAWCAGLGEETFVGSSGRVFPSSFRATPLLRAWLRRLDDLGVDIRVRHSWTGWDGGGALLVADAAGVVSPVAADATVLAVGGASWPRVGSTGSWVPAVVDAGVEVAPLRPANCGLRVAWTPAFSERLAGTPLKNVALAHGATVARGDAVVTRDGLEGGAVYAVAASLRDEVEAGGEAVLRLDLRPDLPVGRLADRLRRRRPRDSASTALRRAGLGPVEVGLLREATANQLPADPGELARLVKRLPVPVTGTASIDRAISSAGGVALGEVDETFMLRRRPGTFVAGEMLDWEAPTGGYLLQATFATAVAAARGVLSWLGAPTGPDR
jgi:uncharacterized flavoprotein (TIGR03862 family)